jgi:outer membrane protein TolC
MKKSLALSLLVPFALYSQTLPELVNDAMENQLIDSYKKNVESVKNEYESLKKGYLPRLSINGLYRNTNEETASVAKNGSTASANLSYVLYDGGAKGHRYESYENSIKSSSQTLSSVKNDIALEVINHYFTYESLVFSKEAKQKEIETLTAQKKRLERFFNVGTATSDEVDKIVSRVQSAKVALHEIELDIQTILHNLEYLTAKEVTIQKGSSVKDSTDIQSELKADIKALEYQMKSILMNAKTAKSENYPTVTLEDSYNYYDNDFDNAAFDNGVDTQNIFKVNLSWKLYDFGETKYKYQSLYKQYQALKSQYEYEKNKASVDLKLSKRSYDIAKLKIDSAKAALKAAESTYAVIEKKYQNGLVDNVAYLEALSEKYDAQSSLTAALNDLQIKKAQIIYYSGKNLQEYIK